MKKQTYKKMFTIATASAMAAGAVVAAAPAQADAASKFSDVKETNTHYKSIVELTERGVITGYGDGTYRPGDSIKRGQAAKIIAGVLGLDTKNVTNPGFSDVSEQHAYYGAIAALANAGIISGANGKYNPNGTLTRGQMAKIIDNAFKLSGGDVNTLPFADVKNSQYKSHIANLFANGVTTGVTATKFDEYSPVTRGQLASFVVRAEAAKKATPGTTSTVEKAVTVLTVTDSTVTINGEEFDITPEVASVFNKDNAEALKESDTTLVIEYPLEPTASLANVAAKKGKIVGVKSLKITKSGVKFDAKGYTIPALSVTGNNVTVSNVVTPALEVAAGNTVTLNGVTATTITLAKGAKITVDANTKLTTITLAPGDKIENVITNYAAIKDQLKDTKVEQKTTGGGGGGGSKPQPDTKAVQKVINEGLKDLKIGSASFDGSTLTVNISATADTVYTVADALDDKAKLIAAIKESDILDYVSTVTLDKEYKVADAKALSNAKLALIVVDFLGLDDEALEKVLSNKNADLTPYLKGNTKSVPITFKDGTKKAYTVKIVKPAK